MKIIKNSIGVWDFENSSLLDDIAYNIYCKNQEEAFDKRIATSIMIPQSFFIAMYRLKKGTGKNIKMCYEQAENIIKRIKLQKIKNIIDGNI